MYCRYRSREGYTGVMRGEGSLVIVDPEGKVVYRTCTRRIETSRELKEFVDRWPEMVRKAGEMDGRGRE